VVLLAALVWAALPPPHVSSVAASPACLEAVQKNRIYEGHEGWLFESWDLAETWEPEPWATYVPRLVDAFADEGVQLVVALVPTRGMVHPEKVAVPFDADSAVAAYAQTLEMFRAAGAVAPDLLTTFVQPTEPLDALEEAAVFSTGRHWTSRGAELTARAVASAVDQQGMYRRDVQFRSRVLGLGTYEPRLARLLRESCDAPTVMEPLTRYDTNERIGGASGGGLLDAKGPEVVLLGTSNSANDRFHFHAFLEQHLGADVLNAALKGGMGFRAMDAYLRDDAWHEDRPSLVVWELRMQDAHGWPEARRQFRQVLPAVHGSCDEVPASRLDVEAGATVDLGLSGWAMGTGYLELRAANLGFTRFDLITTHADGEVDRVAIERTSHAPNNGLYFLEPSDRTSAAVTSVVLEAGDQGSAVEVRACPVTP